jgi:competence protein ComEA
MEGSGTWDFSLRKGWRVSAATAFLRPAMSRAILAERQRQPFTDWADLIRRVKGIRSASAERFAAQGLTVNGQTWSAPPPAKP